MTKLLARFLLFICLISNANSGTGPGETDCESCGNSIAGQMPGSGSGGVEKLALAIVQSPGLRAPSSKLSPRVADNLCSDWIGNDFSSFKKELEKEGLTLSEIYFDLKCDVDAEDNLDLIRIAMRSPIRFGSDTSLIYRLIRKEKDAAGNEVGSTTFSCALQEIYDRNMNLIEYIDFRIGIAESDRDNTKDPVLKEGLIEGIRVWEGRKKQYLNHLNKYPVKRSDCPVWTRPTTPGTGA